MQEWRRITRAPAPKHPFAIGEDRHRGVADTDSGEREREQVCGSCELRAQGAGMVSAYLIFSVTFCALELDHLRILSSRLW